MEIVSIVSAYHCSLGDVLGCIRNLREQSLSPVIWMVCLEGSEISRVAGPKVDFKITTMDIPGLYAAWNMVIRRLGPEECFITNANTDDRKDPDGIRLLAQALAQGNDLVYGDHVKVGPGADRVRIQRPGYSLDEIREHCFVGPFPMWRKSLHDRFGLFDESFLVAGDWEFWLRCAVRGALIAHIPTVVGAYAKRADSLEHRNEKVALVERNIILEKYQ